MDRSGKLFEISDRNSPLLVSYNGKVIVDASELKDGYMVAYQSYQTQITGDGIFSMTSLAKHYFFDANMQPVEFSVERGHAINFLTSSSTLGTIGYQLDRDNSKTQIAFARGGKISYADLPGPAQMQMNIVAAKDSAYI